MDLSQYINYSGGAVGSDSKWDEIGRRFGVDNHVHFYHGKQTPLGNKQLSNEEIEEGWQHVLKANKILKRRPERFKSLLGRNWFQVKNAEAVYAISSIDPYTNHVNGGTGWAVQMAIDSNKPVYVYDQITNLWYKYTGWLWLATINWVPELTKQFAGIGTREINLSGIEAITNVYKKASESIDE